MERDGEQDRRGRASGHAAHAEGGGGPGRTHRAESHGELSPERTELITDGVPHAGAMHKTQFLAELRTLVSAAVEQELAKSGATDDCPYIEQYFTRYANEPAMSVERVIRRWIPAALYARSAKDLMQLVVARVREATKTWQATHKLPADLVAANPALAAAAGGGDAHGGGGGRGGDGIGRMTLGNLEHQLGAGQQIDGATASRMGGVIGADVSGAKIHTGPTAAAHAASVNAHAFAVGENVVMGAGAPAPGTFEGDILLAHELAHTAQQRDAAHDPSQRKKPIGEEDAAAERDAGAERLAKLGNFAGAMGDVMRTGLQLQRCPGDAKLPPGPPLQGKVADKDIANVPLIQERIEDDIAKGINGENQVFFHDTEEDFAKAWHDDSILVGSIFDPKLSPDQLDKLRWQAAHEQASHGGAFTNFQNGHVHIHTKTSPAFVTIHELMHQHTDATIFGEMPESFIEGTAHYFTKMVCEKNKVPFDYQPYKSQTLAAASLAKEVGDETLANYVFSGTPLRPMFETKRKGLWIEYKRAWHDSKWDEIEALHKGVKNAFDAKEAADAAERDKRDEKARDDARAKELKERETWPPEGKSSVKGRIINVSVHGADVRLGVSRGGRDGVREGWTARGKLDGSSFETKVIEVHKTMSVFGLPGDAHTASGIQGDIELSPPTSR